MFVEKNISEFNLNPYTLFAEKWAALSVGNKEDGFNAMTIAWGTTGALWEKTSHSNRLPVMTVYVRPKRYTNTLMKKEEYFSVAVFNDKDKKILGYLGSHSGKTENKYEGAGITPVFEENTVYPEEAEIIFICKKVYSSLLDEEGFQDKELIEFNYPNRDFHKMYVGQIEKILVKEI